MKWLDIITEGRDAPLFHFTSNLRRVLAQNALRPGVNAGGGISLTRSLASPFYSYSAKPDRDCLVLDQAALSRRFHIVPQYGDSAERLPPLLQQHRADGSDPDPEHYKPKNEQEERVFGVIQPLNRYLLAIVVEDNFLSGADLSMRWVQKAAHDSCLMTIMAIGSYSASYQIPVVQRAALRNNGTWSAEVTKPFRMAAGKIARRHAKDAKT